MDLVINGDVVSIDSNQANYIMHCGFNSISISEKIDTADALVSAINKVLNPFVKGLEGDYKDFNESNFHFYSSIFSTISDVEIIEEVENKSIIFKFKGTKGTFWV